ncbi:MAG TPA: DUF1778 domain-containing protein [Gaiellaceae bacterium]|jgi:hypothetical protein
MRSLRLDPELDLTVRRAAAVAGESVSEFIRVAVARRAEDTLAGSGRAHLADVAGVIDSGSSHARRTGEAFADLVAERRARR